MTPTHQPAPEAPASYAGAILAGLLALLFSYAALSKLAFYQDSKQAMLNQVFPDPIAVHLVWLIPVIELGIVGLLLFNRSRLTGFYAAACLLTAFTIYIALGMSGAFGRIPCSCGGILAEMGYGTHLIFNLFFLAIALTGIAWEKGYLKYKGLKINQKGEGQKDIN